MKNAVYLDFGLKDPETGERRIVKGEGYGILMDALFRKDSEPEDHIHFLFGAALDRMLFGHDVLLESLQLIQCSEAILFRLTEWGWWSAVQYRNILTDPERLELGCANGLYASTFGEGELPTTEPAVSKNTGPSFLRVLRRWAFGR